MRLPEESERSLIAGLGELHFPADRIQRAASLLTQYARLLHAWAQRLNLTAHKGVHDIERHLLLDAAALAAVLPVARRLVDIGSGAGVPGIPIAVLQPETAVVVIEARERRYHFLRTAVRELGLTNVEAVRGRAELLLPTVADCAVAQAAGPFADVVTWLLRWTKPGGTLAIPITPAQRIPALPRTVVEPEIRTYRVPLSGPLRAVWLGRHAPD